MSTVETVEEDIQRPGLRRRLAARLAGCHVTLQGEMILSHQGMQGVSDEDIEDTGLKAVAQRYIDAMSGMQGEWRMGICDATLKVSLYQQTMPVPDVYAWLQDFLEAVAGKVYDQEDSDLRLRLDVVGTYERWDKKEDFRFLNKEATVSYKVTREKKVFCPLHKLRGWLSRKLVGKKG